MKTIIIKFPPDSSDGVKKLSAMREESVGTFNFNVSIDDDQYRHLGYALKALNLQFEIENHFKKEIDNKVEKQVVVTIIHNDGRINSVVEIDRDDRWNVWYILRVSKIGDPGYIEYNIRLYASDFFVLNDDLGYGDPRGCTASYSEMIPILFRDIKRKLAL